MANKCHYTDKMDWMWKSFHAKKHVAMLKLHFERSNNIIVSLDAFSLSCIFIDTTTASTEMRSICTFFQSHSLKLWLLSECILHNVVMYTVWQLLSSTFFTLFNFQCSTLSRRKTQQHFSIQSSSHKKKHLNCNENIFILVFYSLGCLRFKIAKK